MNQEQGQSNFCDMRGVNQEQGQYVLCENQEQGQSDISLTPGDLSRLF